MTPTQIARNVSTVAVASIAAWSSWSHMVHVALRFGERPEVAYVLSISVDGMLVVASAAMVEDKRAGHHVRWPARLPALARAAGPGTDVVVIDEIARMELASAAFVEALHQVLARPVPLVATVHVHAHPVTDALLRRPDVEVVAVSEANRDRLPVELSARLTGR